MRGAVFRRGILTQRGLQNSTSCPRRSARRHSEAVHPERQGQQPPRDASSGLGHHGIQSVVRSERTFGRAILDLNLKAVVASRR